MERRGAQRLISIPCAFSLPADLSVHPVAVLPVAGSAAGHSVRPGHRHVVAGLHSGRDAHWRAALLRRQRGRPDEQDRRGAGDATQSHARPGPQDQKVL